MQTHDVVECGNVRLTSETLVELDGRRPVVTVSRADLRRLELRYGLRSERPWLSRLFGSLLVIAGLAPLSIVLRAVFEDGRVLWSLAWMVPFAFAGAYLLIETLRKGYYLSAELPRDRRKLCFGNAASPDELDEFIAEARSRLGYEIADER